MALTKVTGTGLETLSDGVTITTPDNTTQLTLASTDADASVGPVLDLYRNSSSPADNDRLGSITFRGRNDNSQDVTYATFRAFSADVTDGSEDTEFELTTINAGSEVARMTSTRTATIFNQSGSGSVDFRVESGNNANMLVVNAGDDRVGIGTADPEATFAVTSAAEPMAKFHQTATTDVGAVIMQHGRAASSTSAQMVAFLNGAGTLVGAITMTGSATTYATSSDYRLKENVDYTWDATTRLKQLKPARFNFIVDDTNTLVDGFIAHEVSSIVPEAIVGAKDAVDADNNPEYQGIDQSKLVPLLVKTIQELEARLTAGGL